MFGAAAALFVAGGLMVGQMMGAQPLQHVQAAAFQPFDYVTQKTDPPAEDPKADDDGDTGNEPDATATTADPTEVPPTESTGGVGTGVSEPTTVPPTTAPEDEGSYEPPTPTVEPTEEPAPPTVEPTEEPTVEPTVEPEEEEVEPTPDPDPEPPEVDGGFEINPCIINPHAKGCDDSLQPPFELHPCTWTDEPCPGEEEDGPFVVQQINPCLFIECEDDDDEAIDPKMQIGPIVEPPPVGPKFQIVFP
jgi:hypothetical protein